MIVCISYVTIRIVLRFCEIFSSVSCSNYTYLSPAFANRYCPVLCSFPYYVQNDLPVRFGPKIKELCEKWKRITHKNHTSNSTEHTVAKSRTISSPHTCFGCFLHTTMTQKIVSICQSWENWIAPGVDQWNNLSLPGRIYDSICRPPGWILSTFSFIPYFSVIHTYLSGFYSRPAGKSFHERWIHPLHTTVHTYIMYPRIQEGYVNNFPQVPPFPLKFRFCLNPSLVPRVMHWRFWTLSS